MPRDLWGYHEHTWPSSKDTFVLGCQKRTERSVSPCAGLAENKGPLEPQAMDQPLITADGHSRHGTCDH